MALPIVEVETLCPNSSSKAWRCSSRVRSSLASRCLGSHSLSITPFLEGLPGIGSGSTSPVSRRLLSQRFMEGIETEKVFATCSLGLPESTAESTLNLRSFEYGFMPEGYHIWIDTYGCRCQKALEDEGDAALDLQVGVFVDDALIVAHQPGGQFQPKLAALGLAQDARPHPR